MKTVLLIALSVLAGGIILTWGMLSQSASQRESIIDRAGPCKTVKVDLYEGTYSLLCTDGVEYRLYGTSPTK